MTQFIKIAISPTKLSITDWSIFIPPPNTVFPILYTILDGSARLFLSANSYMWIPKDVCDHIYMQDADPQKDQPAPNLGISELTLLRAIAVAQDPSLIKDMK